MVYCNWNTKAYFPLHHFARRRRIAKQFLISRVTGQKNVKKITPLAKYFAGTEENDDVENKLSVRRNVRRQYVRSSNCPLVKLSARQTVSLQNIASFR